MLGMEKKVERCHECGGTGRLAKHVEFMVSEIEYHLLRDNGKSSMLAMMALAAGFDPKLPHKMEEDFKNRRAIFRQRQMVECDKCWGSGWAEAEEKKAPEVVQRVCVQEEVVTTMRRKIRKRGAS